MAIFAPLAGQLHNIVDDVFVDLHRRLVTQRDQDAIFVDANGLDVRRVDASPLPPTGTDDQRDKRSDGKNRKTIQTVNGHDDQLDPNGQRPGTIAQRRRSNRRRSRTVVQGGRFVWMQLQPRAKSSAPKQ